MSLPLSFVFLFSLIWPLSFGAANYQSANDGARAFVADCRVKRADFMGEALAEARAAAARGEVPVGAVLVRGGKVLARAGNRTRELADPTAHAEMLVIRQACRETESERLPEADLYVTLEPCAMCAAAISFARIRRLYFGAMDEKGGGIVHGGRFFSQPTCHHAPEVYSGIGETEAAALLTAFFRERRDV